MKHLKFLTLAFALVLYGCSTTGQARAYQTLDVTITAVDGAMQVYKLLQETNREDLDIPKIDAAYEKYYEAVNLAIDAAEAGLDKTYTSGEVYALAYKLIGLIESYE